jgi:putative ABC transport system permease protein
LDSGTRFAKFPATLNTRITSIDAHRKLNCMLKTYLKIAWRNATANRSYTLISLGSLVLGITLFFYIAIWVKRELSFDKKLASGGQVCRVETDLQMQDGTTSSLPGVGWPIGKVLATDYPEIKSVTYLRDWQAIVNYKGTHFFEDALYADEEFFTVFNYKLSEGNAATALKAPYSVVISPALKEKYFGKNSSALGKTLMLNDTVPYQVTGVFDDLSAPSHLKFDVIGSLNSYCAMYPEDCQQEYANGWFDVNMYNYVLLSENVSVNDAQAKIKNLVLEKAKEAVASTGFKPALKLRPIDEIYLHSGMGTGRGATGSYKTVRLFLLIGIFILVIGCLNFINLSTAKSVERAKEIGIKKVLGSNKGKLIYQFLTETALLCVFAAVVSVLLMIALLPVFNRFTGESYVNADLFSGSNIILMALIVAVLVPLAGFYPALVLSSFKPIAVLKGRFSHTMSGTVLRKGLVITQFVISVAFVMGTLIVWKQMRFMQNQQLGFDKEKILVIDMNKVPWVVRHNNAPAFKHELSRTAGVERVTTSAAVPGRTGWGSQFAWPEGMPKDAQLVVEYIPVDAEYVKAIGLQFKSGRDFMPGSAVDSSESLIINEAAVSLFGWKNAEEAIGKKLSTSGKDGRVIGVLKNYHQHGLQKKINPVVLGMASMINVVAVRYNGLAPKQLTETVQASWAKLYSGYPLNYKFMDEDFQRQYAKEEKFQDLFAIAAATSILIACMGLLGLTIYTAQKRIKEIGIRKVLGASSSGIVALLSIDFLKLVLIAVLIATPLAWFGMSRWLDDFAYRTTMSWWLFFAAGMVALAIAFITISVQAIQAALKNPVKSLRTE